MSEFQYYEFQAIDRPLTDREMQRLRACSSRATITPTRFVNSYSYGDFKGDVSTWMAKYFDAFVYLASWGTHEFVLRLPARVFPLQRAMAYCAGEAATARTAGDFVVLQVRSEDEAGSEWIDEDNGVLASLVPLRSDLENGDVRALYLAWLLCAQRGELDDRDTEPPCPPGLGRLTTPLEAFVDFMRIDRDLLAAAAAGSADLTPTDDAALEEWVSTLPDGEKASILTALIRGTDAHLRAELLRRFGDSRASAASPAVAGVRTVVSLLKAAEGMAETRRRERAARAAAEKARREREAAAARESHLAALARREHEAWCELEALIATKQPKKYDEAVALLRDLRDVCVRGGRQAEAAARIARLRAEHARKPSLIQRFREARLLADVTT